MRERIFERGSPVNSALHLLRRCTGARSSPAICWEEAAPPRPMSPVAQRPHLSLSRERVDSTNRCNRVTGEHASSSAPVTSRSPREV